MARRSIPHAPVSAFRTTPLRVAEIVYDETFKKLHFGDGAALGGLPLTPSEGFTSVTDLAARDALDRGTDGNVQVGGARFRQVDAATVPFDRVTAPNGYLTQSANLLKFNIRGEATSEHFGITETSLDNAARLQNAWDWLFAKEDRTLQILPGSYLAAGRIATERANLIRNCHLTGYGATILFDAVGGFDLNAIGGGLISDISLKGLRTQQGTNVWNLKADAITRFIYNAVLEHLNVEGVAGSAIILDGNFFESMILHHAVGGRGTESDNGYGIYIKFNGSGTPSSIDIFGGATRRFKHGLYAENPVSDFNIFGGTYLGAAEEGVRIDALIGGSIVGVHCENNWRTAPDIPSAGAGMRVSGSGTIIAPKGVANGTEGKQQYTVRVFAGGGGMQIIGGYKLGTVAKFGHYDGSTNGDLTLIGSQALDYDSPNLYQPTIVGGRRLSAPIMNMRENFAAYAASSTCNYALGNFYRVGSLTGNITIENPTVPTGITFRTGDILIVELQQDATGGRTVTWGTSFASAPTAIDAVAGKKSRWTFIRTGSAWSQIAFASTF